MCDGKNGFEKTKHNFPYKWTLKDAVFTKDKGKVFSCFACGGGSTMGYKLAGFDVLGCNEIDPKMIEAYKANHNPKYAYLEPIQTFKLRNDLPDELYQLDILDGSPPCSSFSMAGNREKDTPASEYWNELFRVSKNQIVWGANYFTEYLPASMGWIFWDKGQDLSMSDGELAYTSFNRALRRVKINRGQLMVEGGTIHPTQKPIKLYDWIIQNYCAEANLILDTHVGSGSSRIAAAKAGKQFIGFEIDPEYYEKQEKRFNDWNSQLRMF